MKIARLFLLPWVLLLSAPSFAAGYVSESGFLKLNRLDYDLAALKKSCPAHQLTVPHIEKRWVVSEIREVLRSEEGKYYYQLCRGVGIPKDGLHASAPQDQVAAFLYESKSGSEQAHLIWGETAESFGTSYFERAKLVSSESGRVLVVPHPSGGNAGFNQDRVFLFADSKWAILDSESWKKELRQKLPPGLLLWNEVDPDLGKMRFESVLWRDHIDAHASPTGGRVEGTLAIESGKVILKSVVFKDTPKS